MKRKLLPRPLPTLHQPCRTGSAPPSSGQELTDQVSDGRLANGADCPAKAYERWNWCGAPVGAETYVAAFDRHILRWRCGEEIDEQTGVSHLASTMCCLAILRDAQDAGTLVDNRRGSPAVLAVMDRYDASSMPVVKAA